MITQSFSALIDKGMHARWICGINCADLLLAWQASAVLGVIRSLTRCVSPLCWFSEEELN
jgi:hypothetical protein